MKNEHPMLAAAIKFMAEMPDTRPQRNYFMPGDPNYQPKELRAYLGFDQWTAWLIIVEWFWMLALAKIGVMPPRDAKLLTKERLLRLLLMITNTRARKLEREKTSHDILALLELMRLYLPKRLHKWLHFCATSYDIINTAYALQIRIVFKQAFWPKLREVDQIWRMHIRQNAETLEPGRTHLQTALPVTVGFWLSYLHNRFVKCARYAFVLSRRVPGKFTGAVGTSASQRTLIQSRAAEQTIMDMLKLPTAEITTQITPPEPTARYYHELSLISGALMNLTDDIRFLQSSPVGEVMTPSSSSSAMAHKEGNPIMAENVAGMHISVIAAELKVLLTLGSNLQRDLRWSNVMRSYSATMVFLFQQLNTTQKILKSLRIKAERCLENFQRDGKLLVGELLHLALQVNGYPESHKFVNEVVVPEAVKSGRYLDAETERIAADTNNEMLQKIWPLLPAKVKRFLHHPEEYLGDAVLISRREAGNSLRKAA